MEEYSYEPGYYEWLLKTTKDDKVIAVIGDDLEGIFEQPDEKEKLTDYELIENYSALLVESLKNQAEAYSRGSIDIDETNFYAAESIEGHKTKETDIEELNKFLETKQGFNNLASTIKKAYCIHYHVEEPPHIPDDQELSVEEINWFLQEYGFVCGDVCGDPVVRHDNTGADVFIDSLEDINTKEKLLKVLNDWCNKFSVNDYVEESIEIEGYDYSSMDWEYEVEKGKECLEDLQNIICDFDNKFDKCMAEFHAKQDKDYKNPQRNAVKESESVSKGVVSKPVSKQI